MTSSLPLNPCPAVATRSAAAPPLLTTRSPARLVAVASPAAGLPTTGVACCCCRARRASARCWLMTAIRAARRWPGASLGACPAWCCSTYHSPASRVSSSRPMEWYWATGRGSKLVIEDKGKGLGCG
ncbi:hypothetical protein Hsw_PA0162 (plasmid) [Hymenobacter swuensis DY53]|uniref:Uncharacterized protein n=1 Tax=Hymenobacter swuensis DY53 TaxID=1227739 RepID=W8F0Z9_9BACT|nr:hypothetical protein Hsw_PA0162 [Hymenobacter swuensis DY53]